MGNRAKQVAKYYNQCKLPKWATVLGVVLLAFGIVAAGVTAIFHDKYSSIFGAWESALTNVWFIAFIALVGVGTLISLGYPLLTALGALIWAAFSKPEKEVIEKQLGVDTSDFAEETIASKESKAAGFVAINEAKLRDMFDSDFMHEWTADASKSHLDLLIEDLQHVRNNFKKGAKQDDEHYCINNIIEIAYLLDKPEFVKKRFSSFPKLCLALFDCLHISRPKSVKNNPVVAEHVKKRFFYLLSK